MPTCGDLVYTLDGPPELYPNTLTVSSSYIVTLNSKADPNSEFIPAADTDKDCSITASMFEYPGVSLTVPFYCRMKEQCVVTDVIDHTK